MILTRKLRRHLAEVNKNGKFTGEPVKEIRRRIKNKEFKNRSGFIEYLKTFNK